MDPTIPPPPQIRHEDVYFDAKDSVDQPHVKRHIFGNENPETSSFAGSKPSGEVCLSGPRHTLQTKRERGLLESWVCDYLGRTEKHTSSSVDYGRYRSRGLCRSPQSENPRLSQEEFASSYKITKSVQSKTSLLPQQIRVSRGQFQSQCKRLGSVYRFSRETTPLRSFRNSHCRR